MAATTRAYRAALDAAAEDRPHTIDPEDDLALRQSFSRGFTHGFLDGVNIRKLVHGRFPNTAGCDWGKWRRSRGRTVLVELDAERATAPCPHDGASGWDTWGQARRRSRVRRGASRTGRARRACLRRAGRSRRRIGRGTSRRGCCCRCRWGAGTSNPAAVARGAIVWKDRRPRVAQSDWSGAFDCRALGAVSPLSVELTGGPGLRLMCRLRDVSGHEVRVESSDRWKRPQASADARLGSGTMGTPGGDAVRVGRVGAEKRDGASGATNFP